MSAVYLLRFNFNFVENNILKLFYLHLQLLKMQLKKKKYELFAGKSPDIWLCLS